MDTPRIEPLPQFALPRDAQRLRDPLPPEYENPVQLPPPPPSRTGNPPPTRRWYQRAAGQSSADTRTFSDDLGGAPPGPGWTPGGDPLEVKVIVGAAILIVAGLAASVLATRKRSLRMPTTDQTDAISAPIASILVRHLPMHLLGKDWRDGARAAGATRDYITDGPLVTRARADATDLPVGINIPADRP